MPKKRVTLTAKDGKHYTIAIPAGVPDRPSLYLFAFVKSGSTLMDNMVSEYCASVGAPYFSLYDQAFSQGVRTGHIQRDAITCFDEGGIVFSGFRHFPSFDLPIKNSRVIWLVRDPRDMLVSLYFSIMESHVIPAGNEKLRREREQLSVISIDEFALKRARGYLMTFNRYQTKLEGTECRTFRYEDVVYKKSDWLYEIVAFAGLPSSPDLIESITHRHDIVPSREEVSKHIRQVHPGNFRKKLSTDTIAEINEILAPFLDEFGYEKE